MMRYWPNPSDEVTLDEWIDGFRWIYRPGLLDMADPVVIAGRPIRPGEVVRITNDRVDPRRLMVLVEDREGNEQSVMRRSLERIPRPRW